MIWSTINPTDIIWFVFSIGSQIQWLGDGAFASAIGRESRRDIKTKYRLLAWLKSTTHQCGSLNDKQARIYNTQNQTKEKRNETKSARRRQREGGPGDRKARAPHEPKWSKMAISSDQLYQFQLQNLPRASRARLPAVRLYCKKMDGGRALAHTPEKKMAGGRALAHTPEKKWPAAER